MHGISGELVFACRAKLGVECLPTAVHCKRPHYALQQRPFLQGCPGDLSSRFGALGHHTSKCQVSHNLQAKTVCMGKGDQVKLRLKLPHQVKFGEQHAIMGGGSTFGKWKKQIGMTWSDGDYWVADVTPSPGEKLEFKYVKVEDDGSLEWEAGPNRVLQIPEGPGVYEVVAEWGNTSSALKLEKSQNGSVKDVVKAPSSVEAPSSASSGDESAFVKEWQGKGVGFMSSNNHSSDRNGTWNEAGLTGPSLDLVQGDKTSGSWWKKLEVVRGLVTGEAGKSQQIDTLVYCNIYLQWINTGAIACAEDGGHHRPNRHAEISRKIFRELEWILGARDTNPQARLVIRRMHSRLPAFTAEFTTSVPLTRIRDIAHRNDIPHNLKQEIKHTIQNKLHRNAGPEDLVATEVMLKRVTREPGQYSGAFIEQLQIFYKELKNFFNASTLTEQLDSLRQSMDDQLISVTDTFLDRKKRLDELDTGMARNGNGSGASMGTDAIMGCLHALTGLRAELLKGLESGLRNDASDDSLAMRQKWRLCEIGLEEYSFVILSRFVNALEEAGGAEALASEVKSGNVARFNHPLGATVLGVRQLGLSGWQPAECLAIENELSTWQAAGVVDKEDAAAYALAASRAANGNSKGGDGSAQATDEDLRMWALRLKSTLERARRLAEKYSDTILQLYPHRSQKLGRALGIQENAIRTYAEAEIRASVVYQLARLCSLMLKAVRLVSGGEGWDPLNTGTAVGTLVEIDQIVPGKLPKDGSIVLLVKSANGDEEVKAAGANVAGVILCHELPHLSHLGVRARQERVPFVTCSDEDKVADVRALAGRRVKLEVTPEKVKVVAYDGPVQSEKVLVGAGLEEGKRTVDSKTGTLAMGAASGIGVVQVVKEVTRGTKVLSLSETKADMGGAKAAACGRLAALSAASKQGMKVGGAPAAFKVPAGTCIPFGMMEEALGRSGRLEEFHSLVEASETAGVDGGQLDGICKKLQALVSSARLSSDTIAAVSSMLPYNNPRLIVRSSANVEDLAGMSGAGLYDSIPNVRCSEPQAFSEAVAHVWASLYTRRAILSRRAAGVPQSEAVMAVLVQELLAPTLSFVLHTQSSVDRNSDKIEAEVALGLGETLAAGTKGAPWRLVISKTSGTVETLAFANFSEQLIVGSGAADGRMIKQAVDYSKEMLTVKRKERIGLGQRLAAVGLFLEQELKEPQDIEGCIVGGDIFIVQSRPQP